MSWLNKVWSNKQADIVLWPTLMAAYLWPKAHKSVRTHARCHASSGYEENNSVGGVFSLQSRRIIFTVSMNLHQAAWKQQF